ncbi:hypothetical protein AMTR_s00268p00008990 [Amborella trichopoda]|uniref:Uncharacterized protein n=1 Tax=Amborella trichopoda TaxID=13333 RepID=W1P421_AMBTC|nr:hypothetical protein AMTR_s00268p00008990 [Amborella trichopoda]
MDWSCGCARVGSYFDYPSCGQPWTSPPDLLPCPCRSPWLVVLSDLDDGLGVGRGWYGLRRRTRLCSL